MVSRNSVSSPAAREIPKLKRVFAAIAAQGANALLVGADPVFIAQRDRIVALAAQNALPAIYQYRDFVRAGGLASYGTNLGSGFRLLAVYTAQILKGARPAELPVVQPTKFEFILNLQTARLLGIEVPPSLIAIADEVIE